MWNLDIKYFAVYPKVEDRPITVQIGVNEETNEPVLNEDGSPKTSPLFVNSHSYLLWLLKNNKVGFLQLLFTWYISLGFIIAFANYWEFCQKKYFGAKYSISDILLTALGGVLAIGLVQILK